MRLCLYFYRSKIFLFSLFLAPALCDINSFVFVDFPGVCGFSIIPLWSWEHCMSGFPFIYLFLFFAGVDMYGMCLHVYVQVPLHMCGSHACLCGWRPACTFNVEAGSLPQTRSSPISPALAGQLAVGVLSAYPVFRSTCCVCTYCS